MEVMTAADERVLSAIDRGIVLAPLPFSDVLSVRPGLKVVYGKASVHADQLVSVLEPQVETFFSTDVPANVRADILDEWCVDYVACSDTWPLSDDVVEELRAHPRLEVVASEAMAILFRVIVKR